MKCKLCRKKDATRTGSHIVPHFILKQIDNDQNSKKRDKELGFEISSSGAKNYFGRDIFQERLEEIYGKGEVTDELIAKNKLPLVQDHIFCNDCENKLGKIESEYADKIKVFTAKQIVFKSINPLIAFLFWISVLWRLSISGTGQFKLKSKEENLLRCILRNYLRLNVKQIVPLQNDKQLKLISYKILQSDEKHLVKNKSLLINKLSIYPLYLVAGNFIVSYYFKSYKSKKNKTDFLSYLGQYFKKVKPNTAFYGENILYVGSQIVEDLNSDMITLVADNFMTKFLETLDHVHQLLGGTGAMPEKIKAEVLEVFKADKTPLGNKYSSKNMAKIIEKALKKYGPDQI
jgi:hypothetical protein